MARLILASSSVYRRELLLRLNIEFECQSPDIDESSQEGETPEQLVCRLSEAKARALENQHPNSLIIGSDQVATLDKHILTKPGNHKNALEQLTKASGRKVIFYTGLCLLNSETNNLQIDVITYSVTFRTLTQNQIEHYLKREQPYDCAGSFKSEGLGVALFEKMEGDDPNALIGLPLVRLTDMLAHEGVNVL
ncbi:MAG: septum formation inhibitor Maf [Gammaproteobacteria bacterium]|nr:septum formation inhibitor Maf [Gammaproteobacteria bacterium]